MTRITWFVLALALVAGCQRGEQREATQTAEKPRASDTVRVPTPPDTVHIVSGTGLVLHIDLEGGFYGIVDDLGERYDPSNMPEDFKVDSLRVRYEATVTDKMSSHMWGKPVDIITIERLD